VEVLVLTGDDLVLGVTTSVRRTQSSAALS